MRETPRTDAVFDIVLGCERHGHAPARLDIQLATWRELMLEMAPTWPHCWAMPEEPCGDATCEWWRRMMAAEVGDEPGDLIGIPVRIVPNPPPGIVAVHEEAPAHV